MNVSICVIARLENPYINEWIGYHLNLGFNHIYIYDNSFGNEETIDKAIKDEYKDFVTIIPIYGKVAYQKSAYNDCYKKYNSKHDWIMFIDVDEFLILKKHKTIQEHIEFCVNKNPNIQSIVYNWVIYDDNDLLSRDIIEPVMKSFTKVSTTKEGIKFRRETKSVIKCKLKNIVFTHVHYAKQNGKFLITSNSSGNIENGIRSQCVNPITEYAQLNHYMTKTITEYVAQKLHRGDADGYIVRNIENRFFSLCTKSDKKVEYYNKIKNLTNYDFLLKHRNIVITMTSFPGRINQVAKCLESCVNQSIKPHKVYLNLSKDEFPKYESLPDDLRKLDSENELIEIKFVNGNSKCFKKVIPILDELDGDDIILYTDDDMILKHDVLKSRLNDFYFYLCKYPITGYPNTPISNAANEISHEFGIKYFSSAVSLVARNMLNGYESLYNDEVEKTYHDDLFYTVLLATNGYAFVQASRLFAWGNDCAYTKCNNVSNKRTNIICITEDVIKYYISEIKKSNFKIQDNNIINTCKQNNVVKHNVASNNGYKLIPFAGGFIKKKI